MWKLSTRLRWVQICKWTQSMMEKLPVVPVSGVRDVRWIDHDSISLLSEVRDLPVRTCYPR